MESLRGNETQGVLEVWESSEPPADGRKWVFHGLPGGEMGPQPVNIQYGCLCFFD